jgi:probable O-glycosylation ligase (exosortase A-associated)
LTVVLALFVLCFTASTLFSVNPDYAWPEWERTIKILLFTFLTIVLMQKDDLVKTLIWVIALSFAFFGVKGGYFSIITAGDFRVFGPPGTFIEDNNALALAMLMGVPLMRFCQTETQSRFGRYAWAAAIGLSGLSILTSHSRGALLGVVLTLFYAWWKSKRKIIGVLLVIPLIPLVFSFMPDHWFDRMSTISDYQQDDSALGRINAWWFAFNLALDRPFFGGGFQAFIPELFERYAPDPDRFHDAHSIYFEVLAEQGFVGLALFLLLGAFAILECTKLVRMDLGPEREWIPRLASLLRLSFVGYAVTGAFLGLAYFDLYYQLIAVVVLLRVLASRRPNLAPAVAARSGYVRPATEQDAQARSAP